MKGIIDRYKSTAKEEPPGSAEVNKVQFGLINLKSEIFEF